MICPQQTTPESQALRVRFRDVPAAERDPLYAEFRAALEVHAVENMTDVLRRLLNVPDVIEGDDEHRHAIRRFFLEPQDTYTIEDLAALWRLPTDDVRDVCNDEIISWVEANPCHPQAYRIDWMHVVQKSVAFNLLRPLDVERALGSDFDRVRPQCWRTKPILIHVPRFVVDYLASETLLPQQTRSLAARIERFILELFEREYCAAFARAVKSVHPNTPPQ